MDKNSLILKVKIMTLDEVMEFLESEWGDTDFVEELFDELKELLTQKYTGGD